MFQSVLTHRNNNYPIILFGQYKNWNESKTTLTVAIKIDSHTTSLLKIWVNNDGMFFLDPDWTYFKSTTLIWVIRNPIQISRLITKTRGLMWNRFLLIFSPDLFSHTCFFLNRGSLPHVHKTLRKARNACHYLETTINRKLKLLSDVAKCPLTEKSYATKHLQVKQRLRTWNTLYWKMIYDYSFITALDYIITGNDIQRLSFASSTTQALSPCQK